MTILEDLADSGSRLFEPGVTASDPIIETRVVDELVARKSLVPQDAAGWPSLEQGPLEGVLMAEVVIDRGGKIREIGNVLSDNPGLTEAAGERIRKMKFQPLVFDGRAVQVVTTVTMAIQDYSACRG